MEEALFASLIKWFIGLVSVYPAGTMVLTVLGTVLVLATILMPVIVKLTTWTTKDDEFWARLEKNKFFKIIVKVLNSFSIYQPKK